MRQPGRLEVGLQRRIQPADVPDDEAGQQSPGRGGQRCARTLQSAAERRGSSFHCGGTAGPGRRRVDRQHGRLQVGAVGRPEGAGRLDLLAGQEAEPRLVVGQHQDAGTQRDARPTRGLEPGQPRRREHGVVATGRSRIVGDRYPHPDVRVRPGETGEWLLVALTDARGGRRRTAHDPERDGDPDPDERTVDLVPPGRRPPHHHEAEDQSDAGDAPVDRCAQAQAGQRREPAPDRDAGQPQVGRHTVTLSFSEANFASPMPDTCFRSSTVRNWPCCVR